MPSATSWMRSWRLLAVTMMSLARSSAAAGADAVPCAVAAQGRKARTEVASSNREARVYIRMCFPLYASARMDALDVPNVEDASPLL